MWMYLQSRSFVTLERNGWMVRRNTHTVLSEAFKGVTTGHIEDSIASGSLETWCRGWDVYFWVCFPSTRLCLCYLWSISAHLNEWVCRHLWPIHTQQLLSCVAHINVTRRLVGVTTATKLTQSMWGRPWPGLAAKSLRVTVSRYCGKLSSWDKGEASILQKPDRSCCPLRRDKPSHAVSTVGLMLAIAELVD